MSEEWRPVVGFEALYEVSSDGRIRRIGRAARTGKGHGGGARIGFVLKSRLGVGGYRIVQLWSGGKPFGMLIHRAVAIAFLGPVPDGKEVNHRSGLKNDNSAANLEYVTRSENMDHAYRTGLRVSGETHPWAKLSADQVREIRTRHQPGARGITRLAREYGVNRQTIADIVNRVNWKGVGT